MTAILKIEPVGAYMDNREYGGGLENWVGTYANVTNGKSVEEVQKLPAITQLFVATGYEVLMNAPNNEAQFVNIIVNSPTTRTVQINDAGDKEIQTGVPRYILDVTPAEYEAAVRKSAQANDPIVDLTREGLKGVRASAAAKAAPHPVG